jgi:glycosyltransferase involved in cell wall biosynthesis
MKILYITLEDLSLNKGSVTHVKEIITGLRKRGHQIGLMARSANPSENADHFYNLKRRPGFILKYFGLKRKSYLFSSFYLFIYLFKVLPRYDVIYARDFHTVLIALFPRLLFNKKLVYEINGIASEELQLKGHTSLNRIFVFLVRVAERMATKYAERIVSVTPQIASYLMDQYRCPRDKLVIVGNGVNTEIFRPMDQGDVLSDWRKKLEVSVDDRVVVFIGNLARWQGVEVLIDAAFQVLKTEEKLKFLIIGEGVLRKRLMEKVLNSGFAKSFIFTGMMDYEVVPFLINLADICVAPFILKRNEKTGVSPLKIFEYMACGKPVIASRIQGLEFMEKERTGRLTEPGDPIQLEEAIKDLLNNPEERLNLGRRGLQIAQGQFGWSVRTTKIENILIKMA